MPQKLLNVDEIKMTAYGLWCKRGRPEGSPEADWFEAERILTPTLAETPVLDTPVEPVAVKKLFKIPHVLLSGGPRVALA